MLMQFSDTPFPGRETVLQYLREYTSEIASMIRFEHQIIHVRSKNGVGRHGWEVETRATGGRSNRVEKFEPLDMHHPT